MRKTFYGFILVVIFFTVPAKAQFEPDKSNIINISINSYGLCGAYTSTFDPHWSYDLFLQYNFHNSTVPIANTFDLNATNKFPIITYSK